MLSIMEAFVKVNYNNLRENLQNVNNDPTTIPRMQAMIKEQLLPLIKKGDYITEKKLYNIVCQI